MWPKALNKCIFCITILHRVGELLPFPWRRKESWGETRSHCSSFPCLSPPPGGTTLFFFPDLDIFFFDFLLTRRWLFLDICSISFKNTWVVRTRSVRYPRYKKFKNTLVVQTRSVSYPRYKKSKNTWVVWTKSVRYPRDKKIQEYVGSLDKIR